MRCFFVLSLYLLFPQPHSPVLLLILLLSHTIHIHKPCIYCYSLFLVFLVLIDDLVLPDGSTIVWWNGINTKTLFMRIFYHMSEKYCQDRDSESVLSYLYECILLDNYVGFLIACLVAPYHSIMSFSCAFFKAFYYPAWMRVQLES